MLTYLKTQRNDYRIPLNCQNIRHLYVMHILPQFINISYNDQNEYGTNDSKKVFVSECGRLWFELKCAGSSWLFVWFSLGVTQI